VFRAATIGTRRLFGQIRHSVLWLERAVYDTSSPVEWRQRCVPNKQWITARACVNSWSSARSSELSWRLHLDVSKVRLVLVALICSSPVILLWDGLIMQGLVAGIVAVALAITARALRPGETGFLVSIVRPLAVAAVVPVLWVMVQMLPLRALAHPIWNSAQTAIGHPVAGGISVDPGASVIALGQYLSVIAVVFLSAAVAVDRQRAEWLLFSLAAAVTAIALIILTFDFFLPGAWVATFARAQAIDCLGMGILVTSAACIRTIERYETRGSSPQRSVSVLLWTFVACSAALAICGAAMILAATREVLIATGCGILALTCVLIIRRFPLGPFGTTAIVASALAAAVLMLASRPEQHGTSAPLALASSASLISLNERMLDDAPLVGTGAGTFAALAPIYREIDDPQPNSLAATAAAAIAIELGKPMFWLIATAMAGYIFILLRASLQRGRDSFYPAMGGSCLITLLLLSFNNVGLFGTTTSLITAAVLGLGTAQRKSRSAKL
jgi:hypothetical protein